MELCARVRTPAGFSLVGWEGPGSVHSTGTATHSSSHNTAECLEVLANLNGSSYLRTQLGDVTVCAETGLTEVHVSLL